MHLVVVRLLLLGRQLVVLVLSEVRRPWLLLLLETDLRDENAARLQRLSVLHRNERLIDAVGDRLLVEEGRSSVERLEPRLINLLSGLLTDRLDLDPLDCGQLRDWNWLGALER